MATHTGSHLIVLIRLDSNLSPEQARKYQRDIVITAGSDKPFYTEQYEQSSFYQVENQLKADLMGLVKREGPLALSTSLFSSPTDETRGCTPLKRIRLQQLSVGEAPWQRTISTRRHLAFRQLAVTNSPSKIPTTSIFGQSPSTTKPALCSVIPQMLILTMRKQTRMERIQ